MGSLIRRMLHQEEWAAKGLLRRQCGGDTLVQIAT